MSPGSMSSILPDTKGDYHLLRIHEYSRTKGIPTGQCVRSRPFIIGGHRWCIDYYPNGVCYEVANYISLSLVLDEDVAAPVMAQYGMRLAGEAAEEEQAVPYVSIPVEKFPSWTAASFTMFITRQELERSKYLRNDVFTIRCDIIVINDYCVQDTPAAFVSVPPCDLRQELIGLLENEKGADVVFEVGGETVAAHRCMLAARSAVFAAELFGPMKEGNAATNGVIVRVEDMEAEVFKALLSTRKGTVDRQVKSNPRNNLIHGQHRCGKGRNSRGIITARHRGGGHKRLYRYVYTGSLPEMCKEDEDVTCQHLLVAADRYGIGRLKLICEAKLCQYINVGSVGIILALAEQHHCVGLKKACFYFLSAPGNLKAVMATDGFQHLGRSCPSIMLEIMAFLAH